jgi:predicted nucleic acid-binding protein
MSGNKLLLDTNIVLYLLTGNESVYQILEDKELYVSFITELELLSYAELSNQQHAKIKDFLAQITILDITESIKEITTSLRRNYRIKLPDSIIAATSYAYNIPLVTADKGFKKLTEIHILLFQ